MAVKKGPARCAFAICAVGDRYLEYRSNVVSALRKYAPGADIVDIDPKRAAKHLKGVPSDKIPMFARLAIPLMKEFGRYERVVWIDADTDVASGDFSGILEVDTSDDGLAAAPDISQEMFLSYMKSRFSGYERPVYFNSGVIVMDIGKIDKAKWRKKLNSALKEHSRNPFRWPDQDILNGNFAINEIDRRYNWIWRQGSNATKGAWLVHYCDAGGRAALDDIIDIRKGFCGDAVTVRDKCVVVAPRHAYIRSWIRAYLSYGNTVPLVVIPDPYGDWEDGDEEYCRSAAEFCGGVVLESARRMSGSNAVLAVAKEISPKSWVLVSDDTEITGNIDECFDYADRSHGFACVQFRLPNTIDNLHPERMYVERSGAPGRLCWMSMVFFHGDANERISGELVAHGSRLDEAFAELYDSDARWHDGFCDFSLRGWVRNVSSVKEASSPWTGIAMHYAMEDIRSGDLSDLWSAKADALPRPKFETIGECETSRANDKEDDAVDAVFVIGTGSVNGNDELRYALRNIDKHCKFVRDVYICGYCPNWVDKTSVKHLQWPDRFSHAKDANIIDKLRHACEQPGIAKRILFCSDDQFQTHEVSWEDFAPRYLRRYASNDEWYEKRNRVWHSRLRKTLEREVQRRRSAGMDANNVFYYQPHIWMQIDRDRFVEYAKWCQYETRVDTIIAAGYFNFIDAEGRPDFDHIFIGNNVSGIPKKTHIAYHDGSYDAAMRIMKTLFPEKCRFEVGFGLEGSTCQAKGFPSIKGSDDPSSATPEEMSVLLKVMALVRDVPAWNGLMFEVSRAEELRLFGVKGWRIVWNDIVTRWCSETRNGEDKVPVRTQRSQCATRIVNLYISNPDAMRTVRFGHRITRPTGSVHPRPEVRMSGLAKMDRESLHERIRAAARMRK